MNDVIYAIKPYGLVAIGLAAMFLNNPLGYVGGGMLLALGLVIMKMRGIF